MEKIKNFVIAIVTAFLTYWIKFGVNKIKLIKVNNVTVDFIFYIIVFIIIYILIENLSKIIKVIKNRKK